MLAALGLGFAMSASAADLAKCTSCHGTIAKDHAGAAHKDVACSTCHTGLDQHLANMKTRPTVNFDPAACGACHTDQYKSLFAAGERPPRQSKKDATGPGPDPFFDRAMGTHGFTKEHDLPRAHVFMAIDQFIVDRAFGGRFQPKDGWLYPTLEGGKSYKVWGVLKDNHPESNEHKIFKPGTAAAGNAVCWTCKSSDLMLDWAYMGDKVEGAKFHRGSNPVEVVRSVNHALNCNFCHDPHTTQPRIIRDALIDAMDRDEKGPSVYRDQATNPAKLTVKEAGVRGFTRKIATMDRADSRLMCAQCHVEYAGNPGTTPDGKPVKMAESRLTNHFPWVNTDDIEEHYKRIGFVDFVHPLTGAKLVKLQHPDVETYLGSTHDKAGATCASCHMPKVKKADGTTYTNHWATSPRHYMKETCLACHTDKTEAQMNATIDAMHGYYTGKLREAESRMDDMFNAFELAIGMNVPEAKLDEARKLHSTAHINWEYWTAVNGAWFHNPDMAVRSLEKCAKAAQQAAKLLRDAAKEVNAKK